MNLLAKKNINRVVLIMPILMATFINSVAQDIELQPTEILFPVVYEVSPPRGPNQNIKGSMDELSIWRWALKQNQIRHIMHDTLSPAYYASADSGLVAYYRFGVYEDLGINGGGANGLRDLSLRHNNAATEGNPELIASGIPQGIDKPDENLRLKIFPNPATDQINIRICRFNRQPVNISLYSSNSVKVKKMTLPTANSEITLRISNLPAGIYFVRLQNEKMVEVGKMEKE